MMEELLRRQVSRLPSIEDRLGDIRGQIAQAHQPSEIGSADPFLLGECGKGGAFAAGQCRVEPACPEQQPDQAGIRFCRGQRVRA